MTTLPTTHVARSSLAPHINILSCTCGWKTVYNHTVSGLSYADSLAVMNDILERHWQKHFNLYRLQSHKEHHGLPDDYHPTPILKPEPAINRLRPINEPASHKTRMSNYLSFPFGDS